MLIRAVVTTLGFALLLVTLALYVQDVSFEPEHGLWAFIIALPLGISVLRGSLGTTRFEYPNIVFGTLVLWIMMFAPSLVATSSDPRTMLSYTSDAEMIGRALFVLWCLTVVIAAGPASSVTARIVPRAQDVLALCIPITLALGYHSLLGRFSAYQRGDSSVPLENADNQPIALVLAMTVGLASLTFLPGFFVLVSARARSARLWWLARVGVAVPALLLFLAGGRRGIVIAAVLGFGFARFAGIRVKLAPALAVFAAMPLAFLAIFAYRTALTEGGVEGASFFDLTAIASSSAGSLAASENRSSAVDSFSENIHARLDMGPQFFAVVDLWLTDGSALGQTLLASAIRCVPRFIVPDKANIWAEQNFEAVLIRSGHFPSIDLAPTPWAQCLYEFGVLGILVGAAGYGLLLRLIDRKMTTTESTFAFAFWAYLLSVIGEAEATTDLVLTAVRGGLVVSGLGYGVVLVLRALDSRRTATQPRRVLGPNTRVVQP